MTALHQPLDHVLTVTEYADASIPHYWIVDLDEPVSLLDCHLATGFGYQDAGGSTDACDIAQTVPRPPAAGPIALISGG